jgi:hypothetical protein
MANQSASHLPLHKGEQLAIANMELPRESSGSPMDFPAAAERKSTLGMLAPESEDESSKHTLYSTRPENDFLINTLFS